MTSRKSALASAIKKNSWNHQYSDLEARSLKLMKFRNTFSMASKNDIRCSGLETYSKSWNGLVFGGLIIIGSGAPSTAPCFHHSTGGSSSIVQLTMRGVIELSHRPRANHGSELGSRSSARREGWCLDCRKLPASLDPMPQVRFWTRAP